MLRVAIAGFGLAGEVFHAPLVAAVDGLEVTRIQTRNPERRARARASHPDAVLVDSADELMRDVDLVVIATPNSLHVPAALMALDRGLHVVVDKPLATSADEARRLPLDSGRLTVFQNRRFDGDFLTLQRKIAAGELGRIIRLESRFERFRPEVAGDKWREAGDPALGGGVLLDLGTHLVDQALQLFGRPRTVYGELHTRRAGAQVEDDVFIALEHDGDVRVHLGMSLAAPLFGPRFRVSGLAGGFACDGLDPQEGQLREGMRPGDPGFGEAPGLEPGNYVAFYEGVLAWVRDGAPAPVDPRDAVEGLEVLDAARRSAETASVIEL